MIDIETSGHNIAAFAVDFHIETGLMLVSNFADDLFNHVLHRDQARGIAVLVDYGCDVVSVLLHFSEQIVNGFRFRDKTNRAHKVAHCVIQPFRVIELEHVAHVNEPEDLVDGTLHRPECVSTAHE